jgi:hypothetical protein
LRFAGDVHDARLHQRVACGARHGRARGGSEPPRLPHGERWRTQLVCGVLWLGSTYVPRLLLATKVRTKTPGQVAACAAACCANERCSGYVFDPAQVMTPIMIRTEHNMSGNVGESQSCLTENSSSWGPGELRQCMPGGLLRRQPLPPGPAVLLAQDGGSDAVQAHGALPVRWGTAHAPLN